MDDQAYATFLPGIYLHYKRQLYEASHLAHDANYENRVVVHYIGLQLDGAHDGPRHAVRSWDDWNTYVHQDGSICEHLVNGICDENKAVTPRFRYLGPVYTASMLGLNPWITNP
jgi:hypothetical protein